MIGLVGLATWVGCSPGAPDGGGLGDPCSVKAPCSDGTVCDYSAAMPTCLDENADPDGDGIPNKLDHCPTLTGGLYLDDLNHRLMTEIQLDGRVYISNAVLGERFVLRACIVNFRTTVADVELVPQLAVELGRDLDRKFRPKKL